ncbi:MAG TPA: hypothetical protein VHI13_01660 [Candidatus Kapabacteria bacterium]|nr:hypothetical protein [Candidatus Kapabacteria bacterium]
MSEHPAERAMDLTMIAGIGDNPLSFTFPLSPSVTVVTTVFGSARNQASVAIMSGSMTVWVGSMNQVATVATVNMDLYLGSLNIKKGATFTLTIPTSSQVGNVLMQAELQSPPNPWFPFSGVIAMWPLTS